MEIDEIAELKVKMQAVLFSIEDGMVMTDFDGNILLLNDAAKDLLGIQKQYPYERKFLDYVSYAPARLALEQLVEGGESSFAEFEVLKGARTVFIKASRRIVTTAQGHVLGQVVALRDITLEKQLEQMKEDFMHSITHDLKSPLTSVQGFLKLFLSGETGQISEQQKYYMEVMDRATIKLLRLINNILDTVKMEAGKMQLAKSEWDVPHAARQIVESFQAIVIQNNIRLFCTLYVPAEEQTVVFDASSKSDMSGWPKIALVCDPILMERTLINLVDNAIKYTPSGGEVELRVEDEPDRVVFSVRDTGAGIPQESLKEIFEKFKQAPGAKAGTGIGLTITKHVIKAHGGAISAESKPGKGTTFKFWIPKN